MRNIGCYSNYGEKLKENEVESGFRNNDNAVVNQHVNVSMHA